MTDQGTWGKATLVYLSSPVEVELQPPHIDLVGDKAARGRGVLASHPLFYIPACLAGM